MNYLITIEHPAWAHQFKSTIKKLIESGHDVKILVIDQDVTAKLLDKFGIKYVKIGNSTGSKVLDKAWIFFHTTFSILWNSLFFKTDVFIGRASPMVAIVSWLTRKPHIIYEDTERSTIALWFCKRVSKIIITPKYFKTDLGESHVKTDSFKELFYLHRKNFEPDSSVLKELDIKEEDPFILIRYIAWNASHDFGEFGFSESGKIELLKKLSKKFRIFISSEEELPKELKKYELRVSAEKIHHVLYYASLFISESGTMSTEACLLGTPVVYVATIAKKLGNFIELKERYDLLHFYDNEEDGWTKIQSITEKKSYKEQNKYKLDKLYQEKIDIERLYYWAITNYPRSINILKDSCESNVLKQLPRNI